MTRQIEKCFNCDRIIGRLEHSCAWGDRVVCVECFKRLSAASSSNLPSRGGVEPDHPSEPLSANEEERVLWVGSPSALGCAGTFIVCGLAFLVIAALAIFVRAVSAEALKGSFEKLFFIGLLAFLIAPAAVAARKLLELKRLRYEITSQRIRIVSGIFNRNTEEIELYRVKDTTLHESFGARLFHLGDIRIYTSDRSSPIAVLKFVRGARELRESIRKHVEERRDQKGIREVDLGR